MIAEVNNPRYFLGNDVQEDQTGGMVGKPKTAGYAPSVVWSQWVSNNRTPPFNVHHIPRMLVDPRLRFGLYLIKGPLASKAKIFVKCENAAAKAFIVKTICRFWQNSLMRALKAVEWGYSGCEATYRQAPDGSMEFHCLRDLYALDVTPIENVLNGTITGCRVGGMPGGRLSVLRRPRLFWHVHGREHQPIWGLSRFFPCWKTFLEKWDSGGYRDIRRLFYYKCAFTSGVIYYPDGDIQTAGGAYVNAQQYAQQLLEQSRTGANFAFPNSATQPGGGQDWVFQPAQSIPPPPGLDEYGDRLDDELWEGMGIPPEIARAEGTGAYAGRLIPQQAFLAGEQELLTWLIYDLQEQILDDLVMFNFGPTEYELQPYSMLEEEDKEDAGQQPEVGNPNQLQQDSQGMAMAHDFTAAEFRGTGAVCLHPATARWRMATEKKWRTAKAA